MRISSPPIEISLALLLVWSGCDDGGTSSSSNRSESSAGRAQQKVAPSGESDESSSPPQSPSEEGSEGSDSSDKEPEPGWEIQLSGDASGTISGFSVLHGHADEGERIRLVPEMKQGEFSTSVTLLVLQLKDRSTGSYRVARAELMASDQELDCQHPAPSGAKETEMMLEVQEYNEQDFRGTFEGTLQCQPRNKEEKEDPPRISISGDFVDN